MRGGGHHRAYERGCGEGVDVEEIGVRGQGVRNGVGDELPVLVVGGAMRVLVRSVSLKVGFAGAGPHQRGQQPAHLAYLDLQDVHHLAEPGRQGLGQVDGAEPGNDLGWVG